MLSYLDCDEDDYEIITYLETKPPIKLFFPLNLFGISNIPKGRSFLRFCKFGTLKFCLVRPSTAIIAIILDSFNVYQELDFNWRYGYVYLLIIMNISVAYAFIILAIFYSIFKSKLQPFEPVGKFLCIKFVIFLTFWQGLSYYYYYYHIQWE